MKGWKREILSTSGREILIKAVATSLPAYPMSVFKFPKKTCKDINSVIAAFWWGQNGEENKIHWQKWSKMTKGKMEGGMGFRDIEKFNQALLAKNVWRFKENPDALWARIIKGIYFQSKELNLAKKGCHPSCFWSSFLHGRDLVEDNACWKLGNGEQIRVWEDRWIPGLERMKLDKKGC